MSSDTAKNGVVCVFCASSPGKVSTHLEAAKSLAHALHAANLTLVYGGGTTGLMGEIARSLVSLAGAEAVHGIIPKALIRYEQQAVAKSTNDDDDSDKRTTYINAEYGRVTIVKDMHERKALMAQSVIDGGPGGGFVALSGGFGTIEELMEITTWNQLGIHQMPIVAFNVEGYWDGLLQWVNRAVAEGFVREGQQDILVEAKTAEDVIRQLAKYQISKQRLNLDWGQK